MKLHIPLFIVLFSSLNLVACNGGSSSSSTPPPSPSAPNVAQVTAGSGYNGQGVNTPYITVTVCVPNTTTCQTLDSILLDTGSVGLKINQSQMSINLPPILQQGTNLPFSVCNLYGSGYAFATANYADVYIAGEKAANIPIQIIDDSDSQSGVPASCSNQGQPAFFEDSGARGIIGVNPMINVPNNTNIDYVCSNGNCQPTTTGIPVDYFNVNPIGYFANDNNGEIISFPAVTSNTNTNVVGTITFGLNTESNNIVPGNISSVLGDPNDFIGQFKATAQGLTYNSMFDSGTNTWLFYDQSIPVCSGQNYCPSVPTTWQSSISSFDDSGTPIVIDATIQTPGNYFLLPFWGAPSSPGSGLYGLPFYFGKTVYLGFIGSQTTMGSGPTWGFTNN